MPLFYADASALVKLVRVESESASLHAYLEDADLVSSELLLVELPRAARRVAALDPEFRLEALLERTYGVIDEVALQPLESSLLIAAGALTEPGLRALDAIHVISAVAVHPIDAFITYDNRQAAAARLAGLRTMAPGR
ncbi:MAG TPA: type II toxin-antitoxin system VapC family toxin [Solirubrobacterales bacterium]|nr:type II toxin-antitoxin system VapC family toxin [Solirubrobacterales bacterium]